MHRRLFMALCGLFWLAATISSAEAIQFSHPDFNREEITIRAFNTHLGREIDDRSAPSDEDQNRIFNASLFIRTYDAEFDRLNSLGQAANVQAPFELPALDIESEEIVRLVLTMRIEAYLAARFEMTTEDLIEVSDQVETVVDMTVNAAGEPASGLSVLVPSFVAASSLAADLELARIPHEATAYSQMAVEQQAAVREEIVARIRNYTQFSSLGLSQTSAYTIEEFVRNIRIESVRADTILGVDHEWSLRALNLYSNLLVENASLEAALEVKRELLTRRLRAFGADSDEVAMAEGGLAWVLGANGEFEEADELIARLETRNGIPQDSIATLLLQHYVRAGLTHRTELVLQELDIERLTTGCGEINAILIQHYLQAGERNSALALARANLENCLNWNRQHGFTSLQMIGAFTALTDVAVALAPDPEAHPVYETGQRTFTERFPALIEQASRIENLNENRLDQDHPSLLRISANAAALLAYSGRLAEAEDRFDQSLELAESRFGASHPVTLHILGLYTRVLVNTPRAPRTSPKINRIIENSLREAALDLSQRSLARNPDGSQNQISGQARLSLTIARDALSVSSGTDLDRDAITDAAFTIAQAFSASAAADALEASSARLGASDPQLQQILDRRRIAEASLIAARTLLFGLRAARIVHPERESRAERQWLEAQADLNAANRALENFDAEIAALIARRAAPSGEVQSLLRPNEALITYSFSPADNRLLAFVVTSEGIILHSLDTDIAEVQSQTDQLRHALEVPSTTDALLQQVFDLDTGVALYQNIFEPLRPYLDGRSLILVVSDGPLEMLALHTLPTARPEGWTGTFTDYRETDWLSDEFAFARLPAVSSLGALRRERRTNINGNQPLLGFADPLLSRTAEAEQETPMAAVFADELLLSLSGNGASALSELSAVPQTRRLLENLGQTLRADNADLYFAESAQESRIHQLNEQGALANYRNIAFATHALIDGAEADIDDLLEPALVLTPPAGNSLPFNNDGLLRASEIVGLRLDAEFIILAACNTAAPDGSSGSEALSGLVKAFFFAGARSVLVSNWPAEASATAILSSDLVENMVSHGDTRAVALQSAMRRLRENEAPHFSHPALWAPFMVVSDG